MIIAGAIDRSVLQGLETLPALNKVRAPCNACNVRLWMTYIRRNNDREVLQQDAFRGLSTDWNDTENIMPRFRCPIFLRRELGAAQNGMYHDGLRRRWIHRRINGLTNRKNAARNTTKRNRTESKKQKTEHGEAT